MLDGPNRKADGEQGSGENKNKKERAVISDIFTRQGNSYRQNAGAREKAIRNGSRMRTPLLPDSVR